MSPTKDWKGLGWVVPPEDWKQRTTHSLEKNWSFFKSFLVVTGKVWALLRPSKTGNGFMVFFLGGNQSCCMLSLMQMIPPIFWMGLMMGWFLAPLWRLFGVLRWLSVSFRKVVSPFGEII